MARKFLDRILGRNKEDKVDLGSLDQVTEMFSPKEMLQEISNLPSSDSENIHGSEMVAFIKNGQNWQKISKMFTGDTGEKEIREVAGDPLVTGALEMYADDATQQSMAEGQTIWTQKDKYRKDVNTFFMDTDVENRIWEWFYNLALWGNVFLRTPGEKGKGVTFLDDMVPPFSVRRVELNSKLIGFHELPAGANQGNVKIKTKALKAPYDYVHMMLGAQTEHRNFIQIKKKGDKGENKIAGKLSTRAGTSLIASAVGPLRVLKMLEEAIAMARVARSGYIRIFHVDTTGLTPKQRKGLVQSIQKRLQRTEFLDSANKSYKTEYSPAGNSDDIVMPHTNQAGQTSVEGVGGDLNIRDLADVDFILNKVFAGLRVPKAFLGFEDSIPGSLGSTTLLRLDIRYARAVKKLQRAGKMGIQRAAQIHLAYKHDKIPDSEALKMQMTMINGAEEAERQEALSNNLRNASDFIRTMQEIEQLDLGFELQGAYLMDYIFQRLIGDVDVSRLFKPKKDIEGGEEDSSNEERHASIEKFLKEAKDSKVEKKDLMSVSGDMRAFLPVLVNIRELKRIIKGNPLYENVEEEAAKK